MVHIIDTLQLQRTKIIAATVLETSDGLAFFDCGPESTFDNVLAGLRAGGLSPNDVRHVFLSHIHLDHAGAAWRLAEFGATVYVHPRGAPHLINPAKLIESATRIYGNDMGRLWGRLAPVPESQVRIANDGDVFQAGQFQVRAVDTPGHANHHNVYHWDDNVFGGDVAGVTINGGPPIPPFVPPELHIESWQQSLDKIRAMKPARFYLPHYGLVEDGIDAHLDAVQERLHRWSNWFRDQLRAGKTEAELIPMFAKYEADDLQAGGSNPEVVKDYEYADPSFMAVSSSIRYWNKFHPDALGASGNDE
jgi:glyoxylase-like metal-dependent hydrolase (beta-lactamase superfamily II)